MVRTLVSYVPSQNVFWLRRLKDLPLWLSNRPHEADFLAFRHYVEPHPRVLDVGANRGQAIVSLRRVLDRPKIWSFEPNRDLASHLRRRFSNEDVEIYPVGLGRRVERLELYVPRYGHTVWDTRASVVEAEARRHLSPEVFWRFDDRRAAVLATEVEIRRLDEFDLAPQIIKIDVEGTESDVIDGGFDTIRSHLPIIVVEGNGAQAAERLRALGYRRHRFDPVSNAFIRDQAGVINTFLLCEDHHGLFHLTRAMETAG